MPITPASPRACPARDDPNQMMVRGCSQDTARPIITLAPATLMNVRHETTHLKTRQFAVQHRRQEEKVHYQAQRGG